jgi:hypothetical protein
MLFGFHALVEHLIAVLCSPARCENTLARLSNPASIPNLSRLIFPM